MITFRQKQHHVRYVVAVIFKNDFVKVVRVTDDYWKATETADSLRQVHAYRDDIIDICVYERI